MTLLRLPFGLCHQMPIHDQPTFLHRNINKQHTWLPKIKMSMETSMRRVRKCWYYLSRYSKVWIWLPALLNVIMSQDAVLGTFKALKRLSPQHSWSKKLIHFCHYRYSDQNRILLRKSYNAHVLENDFKWWTVFGYGWHGIWEKSRVLAPNQSS